MFRALGQTTRWAGVKLPIHKRLLKYPIFLVGLSVTGVFLTIRQMGGFQVWETVVYDYLIQQQPHVEEPSRVVVVEITENDIRNQQSSIMSDQVLAQVIDRIQTHQPRVIGLDIFRDIPQPPGYEQLMEQLDAPNVVVINELGDFASTMIPAPTGIPPERVGFNDLVLDPDDVLRRYLMYASFQGEQFYSFSLQLSLNYLADYDLDFVVKPDFLRIGDRKFQRLTPRAGGYQSADAAGYQVFIRYHPPEHIRTVSLTDVLTGNLKPEWLSDNVVLIGTTARTSKDFFSTPYSANASGSPQQHKMAGVLVHALLTNQILGTVLDQAPLTWFWPEWVETLWISGWALIGGAIAWRLKHPAWLGGAIAIAIGSLFGLCWLLLMSAGWVPFVAPAFTLMATATGVIAYRTFHVTYHDPLTGLPNRTLFLKESQRILASHLRQSSSRSIAVLFLDLNRFKVINESLGHQIGDQLLVTLAHRLKACVPPHSHVARVGGNEFAVLLTKITDAEAMDAIADDVQLAINQPIILNEQEIFITTSIGIAVTPIGESGDSALQAETLLRDAHTAMYRAKALGKPRQLFASSMHACALSRLQLEQELRQALKRQEFVLNYQPIVSLGTGEITGFEALVRWQHPKRGFVSPGQFISVAEETGLIIPMGRWILAEACRQMHTWHQQFPHHSHLMMGVNLSSRQFTHPKLIEEIEQSLEESQLDCYRLKLEITESMAMSDVEMAIDMLLRLKQMGLTLSIDDFGTGYSSLSYLHRFPTDILKVDRSFVSRMENAEEDAEIVKTIITLGHNLGMAVVAEGVETASQLSTLRRLKCEYGQGYFFAKPMSAKDATLLLERSPQW